MSCVQLADPRYSDAWPDVTLGDAERERETEAQVYACTDLHAAWGGRQLPSVTLCLILCDGVMVITYCPSNPPVSSPPIGLELQLRVAVPGFLCRCQRSELGSPRLRSKCSNPRSHLPNPDRWLFYLDCSTDSH